MTRLTGMLVGSLLMLGVFLLVLSASDAPTLLREVADSEAGSTAADPVMTTAKAEPVENSIETPAPSVTDNVDAAAGSQTAVEDRGFVLDPQLWNRSMQEHETISREDATAVSHYPVWSPFRSEWAANGFARRLLIATEVPVEVVHESPGIYQVVFSYRDDEERQALVERIETITGLELE